MDRRAPERPGQSQSPTLAVDRLRDLARTRSRYVVRVRQGSRARMTTWPSVRSAQAAIFGVFDQAPAEGPCCQFRHGNSASLPNMDLAWGGEIYNRSDLQTLIGAAAPP